jgi:hypothetical protein
VYTLLTNFKIHINCLLERGKAKISEESFGCLASDGANGKTGPFLKERIGWRIKNGATQSLVQIN